MTSPPGLRRAEALADTLAASSSALLELLETIEPERWDRSVKLGEWSPGKDAEHVADALALHLWFVRASLGEAVDQPPAIERTTMTPSGNRAAVIGAVRDGLRAGEGAIRVLTDEQLDLPMRARRGRAEPVARYLERVLIRHVATHDGAIRTKLRAARRNGPPAD